MSDKDFDLNPFLKILQTTFKKKYEEAKKKSWIICLPRPISIKHLNSFNLKFVDMHLLKPSPYFHQQYMSTDQKETKSYEIENGLLISVTDHSTDERTKILSEELGYNDALKPFRVLLIEHPLDPSFHTSNSDIVVETKSQSLRKFAECEEFLHSYNVHRTTMKCLCKKLEQFKGSYLILPDYLYDASCKLKDLIDYTFDELLLSHNPRLRSDEILSEEIMCALESFVIGSVHHKLYPVVAEKFSEQEKIFDAKLKSLKTQIENEDFLKIDKTFILPYTKTILKMHELNSYITPCGKLNCLLDSLDLISVEIKEDYEKKAFLYKKGKQPGLTSDDLIPILVKILVDARPANLKTDLFYIENFHWNLSNKDKLGYCFVTFQAAVEYISSSDFQCKKNDNISSSSSKASRECYNKKSSLDKVPMSMNQELDKLAKMLQESTKELNGLTSRGKLSPRKK